MRRLLAIVVLLALGGSVAAQGLVPGQRALLLLRVLAYDRSLRARAGAEVRIAVAFRPGNADSERERDALLVAIEEVAGRAVVAGLPVRGQALPYPDAAGFRTRLSEFGPAAMVVCAGLDDAIGELARQARDRRVLTVGGSRDQVVRGLAVGLVDRGERAGLVVSPRAAAEQGADLDSALLSVAERVE